MTTDLDDSEGPGPLVNFYRGGRDDRGRTLDEILAWGDSLLESCHDYIQWLFPLAERSQANLYAPVLTDSAIREFKSSVDLQNGVRRSFQRMMLFYCFDQVTNERGVALRVGSAFEKNANWLSEPHNFLRLTRILRSLRLLGLRAEAAALYSVLDEVYRLNRDKIGAVTYGYWSRAIHS